MRLDKLGPRPCLLVVDLDEDFLEQKLSLEKLLNGRGENKWGQEKVALDLTTGTQNQRIATDIGRELVEDYAEMERMIADVAKVMGVNQTAVCGANRATAVSDDHQHAPSGALNLLGGVVESVNFKRWITTNPMDRSDKVILDQRAGNLVWIPPGWFHEVHTLTADLREWKPRRGKTITEHVAPNWVSWVLPKPLAWEALAMLFGGFIKEDQEADFDKAGKKWQRRELINIITRYTGK